MPLTDIGGGSVSNTERNSLARIPLRWMIRECFKAKTGIMFDIQGLREIGIDPSTLYPHVTPRLPPIPVRDAAVSRKVVKDTPRKPSSQELKRRKLHRLNEQQHSFPHPHPEHDKGNKAEETKAEETESETEEIKVEEIPIGTEEEEELKDALSPIHDQLKLRRAWWILECLPQKIRYQRGDKRWVEYFTLNRGHPRYIPGQNQKDGMRVKIHRSVKTRMDACYPWKAKKYWPRPDVRAEPHWEDLDPDYE